MILHLSCLNVILNIMPSCETFALVGFAVGHMLQLALVTTPFTISSTTYKLSCKFMTVLTLCIRYCVLISLFALFILCCVYYCIDV